MNELRDIFFEEGSEISNLEGRTVNINVMVTETLTGKNISTTQTVEIKPHRLSLTIMENTPTSYKPGMMFTAYVSGVQMYIYIYI